MGHIKPGAMQIPADALSHWREHGAVFLLAHPDDEALMFGAVQYLRSMKIPLRFIYTTRYGDKGRLNGNCLATPEEIRQVREKECITAMNALGAVEHIALPYPDMELSYQEKQAIEKNIMGYVRAWSPAAIFGFHPQEITRYADHPDHRKTGEIMLDISAGTNVSHLHPDTACNRESHRPHVFLWTTNEYLKPTHTIPLTDEVRTERNTYLFTYHPSQFCQETVTEWSASFDEILSDGGKHAHREQWVQVR